MSSDRPLNYPAADAGEEAVMLEEVASPGGIAQIKAWPNPFSLQTSVRYDLERDQHVRVNIVNEDGRLVRTLATGYRVAGQHHLTWDGRNKVGLQVAAGLYYAMVLGVEAPRTLKLALLI